MTTPMLIRGGKTYPVTAAQVDLARRGQLIGPVAGLDATARAPLAAVQPAPVTPPAPQPQKLDGRALSRASMLKQIGAQYGDAARKGAETASSAAWRRSGVDPKAAIIGDPPPAAPARASAARERDADGFTTGQRSMLAAIGRAEGPAARARAEARLRIRAA